nr:hypothetical protein [Nitrosomonas nitrosa]
MNEHERASLIEGLEELRAIGPSAIYAKRGTTTQMAKARVTPTEAALLHLTTTMAHLVAGQRVPQAAVIRRAITLYADHMGALLRDPFKSAAEAEALAKVQRGEG